MVEVINSSFIPKKEFNNKTKQGGDKFHLNVFFLISLVVFLSMIIALIGVNLWKIDLERSNRELKENFAKNKENYGIDTIMQFSELNKRISVGKELLKKHYNILPIFSFLEKKTQSNTLLTEFNLEEGENFIFVSGLGIAPDLDDLYLQSKSYAENKNIDKLILSNILRTKEGFVMFNFEFEVDKTNLTTREFIN
ncbi:MAG: hypothetical protein KAI16_01015 [Candidatus Pacebacteria bacterium]|nr:hypothetical protein [Candidatus Paceibacterota bacterium]